ncbi:hypothetical protein ABZP36_001339 [Zizania latifolia]
MVASATTMTTRPPPLPPPFERGDARSAHATLGEPAMSDLERTGGELWPCARLRSRSWPEVGTVTAICCACFLIRCIVVALSAFDPDVRLEVLDHPILDFFYYVLTEILPSALVLLILRKLPPKRVSAQYHPIN